jgi:hypothetical protein
VELTGVESSVRKLQDIWAVGTFVTDKVIYMLGEERVLALVA